VATKFFQVIPSGKTVQMNRNQGKGCKHRVGERSTQKDLHRFRPWISFSGNSSLGTAPDGETADFGSFTSAEESGGI
jgi:hypothetical protein